MGGPFSFSFSLLRVDRGWSNLSALLCGVSAVCDAGEMQPALKDALRNIWHIDADVEAYLAVSLSSADPDDGSKAEADFSEKQAVSLTCSEAMDSLNEKRRTILVAYFPREATEDHLLQALGKVGTTVCARIARDGDGPAGMQKQAGGRTILEHTCARAPCTTRSSGRRL